MAQQIARSRTPAAQEVQKSRGRWNGVTHVRHCDYSPTLGRFIERDPIGFEAGDNNWYRFVVNGPTGKVDPNGLCEPGATEINVEKWQLTSSAVTLVDLKDNEHSQSLSNNIPKPEALITAFVETVLEAMVRMVTRFDLTKAFSGHTTGIDLANKVFMRQLKIDASIRVTVLERRCEAVKQRCWWGGLKNTGETTWVEKTKNVDIKVPLIDMDLTQFSVNGVKNYTTGILVTETLVWQQVANAVGSQLTQLRRNPAALRGAISDAVRAKFPGSTVNLPAK